VIAKAAAPRIGRLARNDVDATRTGARTAPATIAAADTALKIPITRPSAVRGTIRASAVSPTAVQETRPAFPITVTASAIATTWTPP
jgi:hypothetical protein